MAGLGVVERSGEAAPLEVRQQGTHARHDQHSGRQFHGTCRRNCNGNHPKAPLPELPTVLGQPPDQNQAGRPYAHVFQAASLQNA